MMQTYVKTVIVNAQPQDRDGVDGYAITYQDGYTSWCPKAEFERTSRPLSQGDRSLVLGEKTTSHLPDRGALVQRAPDGPSRT